MTRYCLIDHEEVRGWIEEHGGRPALVRGVLEEEGEENPEILHIAFDGDVGVEEISWSEFFDRFDNENLALVYETQEDPSEFSLIDRVAAIDEFFPETGLPDSGDEQELIENTVPSESFSEESLDTDNITEEV